MRNELQQLRKPRWQHCNTEVDPFEDHPMTHRGLLRADALNVVPDGGATLAAGTSGPVAGTATQRNTVIAQLCVQGGHR